MRLEITLITGAALLALGTAAAGQVTTRMSEKAGGKEGRRYSVAASLSGSGRFVAFISEAGNLVAGDDNQLADAFLSDRFTRSIERVNVSASGEEANGQTYHVLVTEDPRYVFFDSESSNLVAGRGSYLGNVYLRDRQLGTTEILILGSDGKEPDNFVMLDDISPDGRFVVFYSAAKNLSGTKGNGNAHIYLLDRQTGVLTLESVSTAGTQGDQWSEYGSISDDGRFLLFTSRATNLVAGDTNGRQDLFLRDRTAGTTTRVSLKSNGTQLSSNGIRGVISGNGRTIVFEHSEAMLPADGNGSYDVYVRDRANGLLNLVSTTPGGAAGNSGSYSPAISANGRYVAFSSRATDLGPSGPNHGDIFVRDMDKATIEVASVSTSGERGNFESSDPAISDDGRSVAFSSAATNLVAGDTNVASDVFAHTPALTMDASLLTAAAGDRMAFAAWQGAAGDPALLVVRKIDGIPTLAVVAVGAFDPSGMFQLAGIVPADHPLAGHEVTFQVLEVLTGGTLQQTNQVTVTFE